MLLTSVSNSKARIKYTSIFEVYKLDREFLEILKNSIMLEVNLFCYTSLNKVLTILVSFRLTLDKLL